MATILILTDAERATLTSQLARLKEAEISFLSGERANRMNVGDEGVGFADVNLEDIKMKIREIEDKLAAADACGTARRRPFKVRW